MEVVFEKLDEIYAFARKHPNLIRSGSLRPHLGRLEKAADKVIAAMEELRVELQPQFAEVASLLEAEGKAVATPEFIKAFTSKHCGETYAPDVSTKRTRRELLMRAARRGVLDTLKQDLRPEAAQRERFVELANMKGKKLQKALEGMTPTELTGLADAAGLKIERNKSGNVSKSKRNLAAITDSISKLQLTEHF